MLEFYLHIDKMIKKINERAANKMAPLAQKRTVSCSDPGFVYCDQIQHLRWSCSACSYCLPGPDNWLVTNIRRSDNTRDNRQPSVRSDETQAPPTPPRVPGAQIRRCLPCLTPAVPADPVCVLAIIISDDDYGYEILDPRCSDGGCKSEMLLGCLPHGRWICSCGFGSPPITSDAGSS